jgi:hypothetical protein
MRITRASRLARMLLACVARQVHMNRNAIDSPRKRLAVARRRARIPLVVSVLLVGHSLFAGTTLDFWHSYVHAQTQERHYSFHLTQCKRGLFWGSCGPSTKSLQWSFTFDLAGDGPVYDAKRISISDDNGKALHVISGQVTTTAKQSIAKIALQVENEGRTNTFIGNGDHPIHGLK